jgi:hypothetical protein
MATQDFEALASGEPSLLSLVEEIVLDSHHRLYAMEGREWSPPMAYRWLRYEDPMPVNRLAEGVEKLDRLGGDFEAPAVEKAVAEGVRRGFSN